jgi:putative pyruvate formate lyase activating enzyme
MSAGAFWRGRIERVAAAYRDCRLCPRDCGVDRQVSSAGAFCGLDGRGWVYKELLSHGEEGVLSPTWLLDLGGCSMRCLFCTEWRHVIEPTASPAGLLDPAWFAARHSHRKTAGARTVSFVGGDPTVSLLAILQCLAAVADAELLPVVMNCNGWLSPLALDVLHEVVATWVVDLKFGNDACAARLAGTAPVSYRAQVHTTLDAVYTLDSIAPPLPKLLIRHLLMPGHFDCCTTPVLQEVSQRWPQAQLNLMTTYLPFGPAQRPLKGSPELVRLNSAEEQDQAVQLAMATVPHLLVNGAPTS